MRNISIDDLAYSKGMPAAATYAMLGMQARIAELEAKNKLLWQEVDTLSTRLMDLEDDEIEEQAA